MESSDETSSESRRSLSAQRPGERVCFIFIVLYYYMLCHWMKEIIYAESTFYRQPAAFERLKKL